MQGTSTIDLISRIKQGIHNELIYSLIFLLNSEKYNFHIHYVITVPQRLINTQCGADYSVVGSSNSFSDYIEPDMMVFYKMHPNYFFSSDSDHISTIRVSLFS